MLSIREVLNQLKISRVRCSLVNIVSIFLLQKKMLGPGTYEIKDFVELLDSKPGSVRGICETRAKRFQSVAKVDYKIIIAKLLCNFYFYLQNAEYILKLYRSEYLNILDEIEAETLDFLVY